MAAIKEVKSAEQRVVELTRKDLVDEKNLYFNVVTDTEGGVMVVIRDVTRNERPMVFTAGVIHQMSRIIDGVMDSQANVFRKSHQVH